MHEMGIASSVLQAVEKERQRYPGTRVTRVGLRVGEFAGVDTESLRFCFEVISRASDLDPVELDITWCRLADGRRGEELELAYLDLEDLAGV